MTGEQAAPLRVLHVVEAFGGGVLEVVTTLAERLARGGDTVAIAYGLRPETPGDLRDRVADEVELVALPWHRRGPRDQIAAGRALRPLAQAWTPDVVHLHSSFAGVVGGVALPRALPTVYTPHGYSFTMGDQSAARRAAYRLVERLVGRRATLVGAVSEAEADFAREVVPASRVVVVPNGIPELDPDPAGAAARDRDGRPEVVTIGRIDAARRPAESARILASLSDVADVVWIGGGGRGGVPPSAVTDLGVPVTGWLPRSEALGRLRSATACLHWAAWDGQPLSILEAMANDVAVVASDIPATRELLGPDQVRGTEREAAALLRRIVTEPAVRDRLIANQRARRERFGAQRMADEWRSVYERIATPGGNGGAAG